MTPAAAAGLDLALPGLPGRWAGCAVGDSERVFGRLGAAGGPAPLPSSAAPLRLDGHEVWLPAPDERADPAAGLAPVYRHADRPLVLPFVRLLRPAARPADPPGVTFLTLSDWLREALTVWRFEPADPDPGPDPAAAPTAHPRTVAGHLTASGPSPADGLWLLAFAVR
jgi:hypothetical protein